MAAVGGSTVLSVDISSVEFHQQLNLQLKIVVVGPDMRLRKYFGGKFWSPWSKYQAHFQNVLWP